MKWSKSLVLSVEILAAHKLRTLLSILGIVVGVAAVILMVAGGKGAEQRILDRIRDMGTNLVTVNAGQTRIIAGRQRQLSTVTTLIPEDAQAVGVTEPKGVDANGLDQDDVVLVPLGTAMRRLMNVDYLQTIYVQAKSSDVLDEAESEIRALLRQRHRLGDNPDDFTIQNQATLLAAERETAQAMTLLIASVSGISLLVGGVGILAVMLISVRERTPEIGLRRAIGARRSDIRTQFLLESALLAGVGGLIGVGLGTGAAWSVAELGYWDAVITWPPAVIGLLFSVTLGIVFGLYPATRAAALEPIEALRSE